MKIPVVNKSGNALPSHATPQAAGMDLCAANESPILLGPGEFRLIPTGLFIELPAGYEAQIRPRSGWAFKHGVTVLNSPGTIDADYRGEIGVLLINHGKNAIEIQKGDRIAQMVVAAHATVEWALTESLEETARGAGGFGHTGKN
ncbi:MAG TPA: dUTP diphosphatase [Bacteroidia bacterium]|nr:dUTP diphosphatase [Bacteroidia bacterium]